MKRGIKIELLAPARDLHAGRAAVDCGADAVYIGGPGFGARHAAGNPVEDVAALVRYARPFGVRVYATLNTLLFDDELAEAERVARDLIAAGVDALIVQDMAWLRMGLSGVEIHASTQTSNIVPEEVAFLGRAGFRRVILERALSLEEIRAIRAATDAELEVFVHGAICVGYSGRCFMSRATSPRSGNRGNCSQPCRLAYDLTDSEGNAIIEGKHLLSVRDLDLSAHLGELLDAGVTSFKIEGRLKDVPYVRNVVGHYRRLLDEAMEVRPSFVRASVGRSETDFKPDPSKSFTRGGASCTGDYFFNGQARGVVSFDTPKSVGEQIGIVEKTGCDRTGNRWFILRAARETLAAGDGICFFAGGELMGININRVGASRTGSVGQSGGSGERIYPNRMEGIEVGTEIFRNYDHAFTRMLQHSRTRRRIRVSVQVSVSLSEVSATFTDETGLSAGVSRAGVLPPSANPRQSVADQRASVDDLASYGARFDEAKNPGKMMTTLCEQLSKSGDTIFDVGEVEITGPGFDSNPGGMRFIPVSMLSDLRREGLGRLLEARERLIPERHPAIEDMSVKFPHTHLTAVENVTNRLAEKFYRDHGVETIEPALELRPTMDGETVMRTRYCIRREIGGCLLEKPDLYKDLYLRRGNVRYRLGFDCAGCEMTVTAAADFPTPLKRKKL